MNTMKGPGIFLAQFLRDQEPFNTLDNICQWAAGLGYKGVQIPTWDARAIDLAKAAESKAYCEDTKGKLKEMGIEVIELAAYLQGQVLVVHPAYEDMFSGFYPKGLGKTERIEWARKQLTDTLKASVNFGTKNVSTLSGSLAWHMMYPWPQRPDGIIDEAFTELVKLWKPVLDFANENGITISYELHPGSDLFDGATFEMFLEKSNHHPAASIVYDPSHFLLQQLDYIDFIKRYANRVKAFHVKDAEFNPDGRTGVYGGYQSWANRAGRFRSLGDGQIDFKRIFSMLTQHGYDGWAILEWECCMKSPEQGARESAKFIKDNIIEVTGVAFDDFAGSQSDKDFNRKLLGLK